MLEILSKIVVSDEPAARREDDLTLMLYSLTTEEMLVARVWRRGM